MIGKEARTSSKNVVLKVDECSEKGKGRWSVEGDKVGINAAGGRRFEMRRLRDEC